MPKIEGLETYSPTLVLMGEGIFENDDVPFETQLGVEKFSYSGDFPSSEFYEPFGQVTYWERQEIRMDIPLDGKYFIVVMDEKNQTGKYSLAIGTIEDFSGGDLFTTLPNAWLETKLFVNDFVSIGIAAFVMSIGIQTVEIDDTYGIGEGTSYKFSAPDHSEQNVKITGDTFDVELSTPAGGLQVPLREHKKEVSFQWFHLADGESRIQIQNTGNTELTITGVLIRSSDPIWFTYDLMVITAGMVIIGFSMGFTLRKPKGF